MMSHRVERHTWIGMIGRCTNPKDRGYPWYGGRGIKVCERWLHSFEAFYQDMGPRPSDKHSIDRIDNDGDYEPSNCRWATIAEQANNRRDNRFIEYQGERLTISQWEDKLGFLKGTIGMRLIIGWTEEQAVSVPQLPRGKRLRTEKRPCKRHPPDSPKFPDGRCRTCRSEDQHQTYLNRKRRNGEKK